MENTNLVPATTDVVPALSPDQVAHLAIIEYKIRGHMDNVSSHLLGIGRCLNEAKDARLVPHGEWEDWIAKTTGLAVRQAQRIMQAAREIPEGSPMERLPFTKIQACLQLPSHEEAEAMAQRVQDEGMSLRKLQEEVARQKSRADAAESKRREVEANLRSHDAQAAHERKQLRAQLDAARAQAPADGITPAAQAQIDQLRTELAEAETMVEHQAELRQQAQQELLNYQAQAARGELAQSDSCMTSLELAAAVRAFVGTAGVLPHMGSSLATAPTAEKQEMRAYVDMVAEWVEGARRALSTVCIRES